MQAIANKFFVSEVLIQMTQIRDVVQNALTRGYLTVEPEEKLRYLLAKRYDIEDFNAFMNLQEAAMTGRVKQESRE